jgi:glycosyltransferase involved in cell wall biosynthesis
LFPNGIVEKINQFQADIINLHWVGNEMLRIEDFKKIQTPIVWTLHDMWPFSGAEHYITEGPKRYIGGYDIEERAPCDSGPDIDRWVWKRKCKHWKYINFTLVCPSQWIAEEAGKSFLFKNKRIEVIPNGIDVSKIKPIKKKIARELLSLPQDKKLILFGAMGSTSDRRKGFRLLEKTMLGISEHELGKNVSLIIFGNSDYMGSSLFGINAHYLGKINHDIVLMLAYSASDLYVIPSVIDNLPNTIMEAMACGIPAVGFNVGGIPEIINNGQTGILTQPYDTEEMAKNILRVFECGEKEKMGEKARREAEDKYSDIVIAKKYLNLYEEVV